MATLEAILHSEKFEEKLLGAATSFNDKMEVGVRAIGRILLERIIENTPKPGDGDELQNEEYVRTGRLVAGWGKAGRALGVSIPYSSSEGAYIPIRTENEIGFRMENHVPYALPVETVGPGLIVGRRWRGGRHMVENATNNTRADGTMERELSKAWKTVWS